MQCYLSFLNQKHIFWFAIPTIFEFVLKEIKFPLSECDKFILSLRKSYNFRNAYEIKT